MQWLIDDDNNTRIKLSTDGYITARDLINRGRVTDALGDTLSASDVTDSDGDLVVDEDMYEELCFAIGKRPTKL